MPDLLRDFDFGTGKITFIDEELDFSKPLEHQYEILREDLAQITYSKSYLLDLGYYPEFTPDGTIRLCVIQDGNWDSPVREWNPITSQELKFALNEAVIWMSGSDEVKQ